MKLSNIKRFWISFILSIPMLIQMFAMPFHWMMPGYNWIAFITTTIIMAISAAPYWSSAWAAFKHHSANMNTLVAVGTISTVSSLCSPDMKFTLKVPHL